MPDAVRAQAADTGMGDGAPTSTPPAPKPPDPAPPRRRHWFGLGRWLGLGLVLALTVVRVWDPAPVEVLRLKTFDLYQLIHPRQAPERPVVIVDIDEESLDKLGQWPWSRTLIADLVDRVQGAGAAAFGFDIVFAEPDRMSPASVAKHMPGLAGDLRRRLRDLPSNDALLAKRLAGARVVLGQSGYPRALGNDDRPVAGPAIATLGGKPDPFLIRFPGLVRNIPVLESAAPGHGFFTLLPERDGIVRRVPAILLVRGRVVPSLAIEMLRVATGQSAILVKTDNAGVRAVAVAGVEIPTDRKGRVWVNYTRHDPARYVSAADVLSGAVAPERLAGKLVLLGTSATGLFDVKATPLDAALPGVEVHAQILETILSRTYLERPNYALGAEVILTALIGLIVIGIVPILGAVTTLGLGAAIALGLSAGSWFLYTREMLLIDVAYPMVASLAVYVTLVFVNYFREEARRRQVRGAFSQYLSPELVEQLASEPDRLVLGGQTREMTVLFCDAHGFTSVAERYKADPQGLTRLMNRLLTPLSHEVVTRRGTIDKYMGDAIMAFWNAPLDDPRHAAHACEAALAMVAALGRLNAARAKDAASASRAFQALKVGIGVNTGMCVVGNFGSDMRFDYTVLGDPVNIASRLEGQSRTYGLPILLGQATARAVEGSFALIEVDRVRVKGKAEPEVVHALLGDSRLVRVAAFAELAARNGEMLDHYRARRWGEALAAVADCRGLDVGTDLGAFQDLYEARIRGFQANPPPADWDSVYDATTK